MMYSETYRDLCHGTDAESADNIMNSGFEIRGSADSWCGRGVYFYDIKKKAWWSAERTCQDLRKKTGKKIKPVVIFADIIDISTNDIFDMRVYKDLCDFEERISGMLESVKLSISGVEDEIERKIILRSLLISYYADTCNKKLVIGNFRQRSQALYEHAVEFANSLDLIFGIETIYCVKNLSIISNIRLGGVS